MSDDPPTHRADPRFLAGLEATVLLGKKSFSCQAVDLNRHGVMIEGDFDAEGHAEAGIRLVTPSRDLDFHAGGRVAHLSIVAADGRTRLGIEFEAIAPDQETHLESLLSRVIEGMNPASLARLDANASITEIRTALGGIPEPHRITLARRALPRDRAFLRHDESPKVLEALCRNPQLTRPEVIQLLRLPHLLPTSLELIARDPRWSASEEIRITIATHPRVTFPIAERMIKNLSIVGIRRVIRRPGLNPTLKERLVESVPEKQLEGW